MALGGGTWSIQNKILPGSYINFISMARATNSLSDRGVATIPYIGDWGVVGEVAEITAENFQNKTVSLFGYEWSHEELKELREFFKHIRIGYLYRLGTGGTKATSEFATAKFEGLRGNGIKITIAVNVDDPDKFDVSMFLETALMDKQTVSSAEELIDNDFVIYDKEATLSITAGTPLVGGANPTVTNADYQSYIDKIESYSFNVIGCPSDDITVKGLFTAFTKRMRDEMGVKFQCILYSPDENTDYEGCVDVLNKVTDNGAEEWSLVYWVTGVLAGTAVNKTAMNNVYDGEYIVDTTHTQRQLEQAILGGKFVLHRVGNTAVRVLADINSLTTVTAEKGEDFKQNQTIRVIDQIANDIAVLFATKYMGEIPNDQDGRVSLWADIVKHHNDLQTIRAIEDFAGDDVVVIQGADKRSVLITDAIMTTGMMEKLYMTVRVS